MIIEIKIRQINFFYFSVSIIELEFQPTGYLVFHLFMTFIQKLTQMPILILFSLMLGGLTEKRQTQFDFLLYEGQYLSF